MSSNGAFAKATGILPFEDAVIAAADCANRAILLVGEADRMGGSPDLEYAGSYLKDAAALAKIAAGLSAYVLMLSEVRP